MPSPQAIQTWAKFTQTLHKLAIVPYQWNYKLGAVDIDVCRPAFYYRIYVAQALEISAYEIFLLYRGLGVFLEPGGSISKKLSIIYSVVVYLLLNVNQWIILRNFEHYPKLFQDFAQLRRIENRGQAQGKSHFHYCLVLIAVACTAPALGRVLAVILNPSFPALLTSLYPSPDTMPLCMKLVLACVHAQMNAFHYMNFAFGLMSILCYDSGVVKMMQELRIYHHREQRTDINGIAEKYTRLSVLQTHHNKIVGNCIFFWELAGISFPMMNLFLGIISGSLKGYLIGLLSLAVMVLMFQSFGLLFEASSGVLHSWKRIAGPKWFVKYRGSCRPLSVSVGSYFFVDKQLVLTILSIVLENTASLVLTYMYD